MTYDDISLFAYQLPIYPREHYLGYFFRLKQLISKNVKLDLSFVKSELSLNEITSNSQVKVCRFLEQVTRTNNIENYHSLIPFYQKFYASNLKGGKSNFIPKQSLKISNVRHWRWCPVCLQQDKERKGVSIWHTNHQNPLVNDCDIHHCKLLRQCGKCHFEVRSLVGGISPPLDNKCPNCSQLFATGSNEKSSVNRLWLEDISQRLLNSNKRIDLNYVKSLVRKEIGVGKAKVHYPPEEKALMRQARLDFYNTSLSEGMSSMFKFNTSSISFNDPPDFLSLTKVAYWEKLFPPIVYLLLMKVFLPEQQINSLLLDI
jgi:hypothetical protein